MSQHHSRPHRRRKRFDVTHATYRGPGFRVGRDRLRRPAQSAQPAPVRLPRPSPGPLLTAEEVQQFEVRQGETVRFRVRAASDEEVHVHGYDILREVPARRTVRVSFPAELTGVYEIEFEPSARQIGLLTIQP